MQTINSFEELDAQTDMTVIVVGGLLAAQKDRGEWYVPSEYRPVNWKDDIFEAGVQVVFVPTPEAVAALDNL